MIVVPGVLRVARPCAGVNVVRALAFYAVVGRVVVGGDHWGPIFPDGRRPPGGGVLVVGAGRTGEQVQPDMRSEGDDGDGELGVVPEVLDGVNHGGILLILKFFPSSCGGFDVDPDA